MTPDEQSLQELTARIDMAEQAIADLREKLAERQTDLTGKQLPVLAPLSLNQSAETSIDTPPPQVPGVLSRSVHRQFPTRWQLSLLVLLIILIIGGTVGSIFGYQVLRARLSPAGKITEFPVPTLNSGPYGITAGPDGNLWFTEPGSNRIGRISPSGSITEFALSTPHAYPYRITKGPDGNLWFTETSGNKIGRITTGQ